MMKHGLVLAAPVLLLCGCDKGVDMKNASASEVADTVKEAIASEVPEPNAMTVAKAPGRFLFRRRQQVPL